MLYASIFIYIIAFNPHKPGYKVVDIYKWGNSWILMWVTFSNDGPRINKLRQGLPEKSKLFNKSLESKVSIPLKYLYGQIKYLPICKYVFEKTVMW